jgi:chromosome partitioning protein
VQVVLPNVLAVVNYKGGVGKTSVAANVAGTAAASGWRVLLVELDAQGNLSRDLGWWGRTDRGGELTEAIQQRRAVRPVRDVRENLDVVFAGSAAQAIEPLLLTQGFAGSSSTPYTLETALAPIAGDYDLVLLDCPPSVGSQLSREAVRTALFLVIPTKPDAASIDGLEGLAEIVGEVRTEQGPGSRPNPYVSPLGVVLFDVGTGDAAIRRETAAEIHETLGELAPMFDAKVRHARDAARQLRAKGMLAFEYERAKLESLPFYKALKAGKRPEKFASNAGGLAADYSALTEEILARYVAQRDVVTAS